MTFDTVCQGKGIGFCFSCPCKILEVFSSDLWTGEIEFFFFFSFLFLPSFWKPPPLWLVVWKISTKMITDHCENSCGFWTKEKKFEWFWRGGGCLSHGKLITFYYPIDHFLFKLICTVCVHIVMVHTVFENHYKSHFTTFYVYLKIVPIKRG